MLSINTLAACPDGSFNPNVDSVVFSTFLDPYSCSYLANIYGNITFNFFESVIKNCSLVNPGAYSQKIYNDCFIDSKTFGYSTLINYIYNYTFGSITVYPEAINQVCAPGGESGELSNPYNCIGQLLGGSSSVNLRPSALVIGAAAAATLVLPLLIERVKNYFTCNLDEITSEELDAALEKSKAKLAECICSQVMGNNDKSEAYCLVADILFLKKDWLQASQQYQKALEFNPKHEDALLSLKLCKENLEVRVSTQKDGFFHCHEKQETACLPKQNAYTPKYCRG